MTKDEFASTVRAAKRRMLRRVYIAVAVMVILMLPLVILGATDSISTQAFQISLAVYSFVSVSVVIYILRRYGSRDVLCPHCQKPLWRAPDAHRVFASGCCVHCGYTLITNDQVA